MKELFNQLKLLLTSEQFKKLEEEFNLKVVSTTSDSDDDELVYKDGEDAEGMVESFIEFAENEDEEAVNLMLELADDQDEYSLEELLDGGIEDGHMVDSFEIGNMYVVFTSNEAAHDAAIEQVRDMLESEPELFTQDWLLGFIDDGKAKRFFEDVYNEWNYSYAEDIQNEGPSDDEFENRLEEEMADRDVDNIDDFVEAMTEDQLGSDGGYSYYSDNFGEEEAVKLVMEHNLIDLDAAVEGAVSADGWAHFLSSYDHNYSDLPSGAVYFRAS